MIIIISAIERNLFIFSHKRLLSTFSHIGMIKKGAFDQTNASNDQKLK